MYIYKKGCNDKLNSLIKLGQEKNIELSVTEIVQYAIIVICIYKSPDGRLDTYFKTSELVIQKVTGKHKTLILCGDWNINFPQ